MTRKHTADQLFFVPSAPPDVRVTVEAPPTPNAADAARLLREMGQEHEKRLVQAMRLDSNHFKAVAQTWFNPMSGAHIIQVHADVNGRTVKVETETGRAARQDELLRQLGDLLARRLADEILTECFAKLRVSG